MPWQKPAHAAEMSKAAGSVGAELVGDRGRHGRRLEHVRDGRDDDRVDLGDVDARRARSPCGEAATDIDCTVSSGVAQRRVLMPERCWIHSSLESIASMISALGITRLAR